MTDKTVRLIGLSDLKTIRVRCNKCETIFEMALDRLGATFSGSPQTEPKCPKCAENFHEYRDNTTAFWQFQHAITRLGESKKFDVEFVVEKISE